MVNSKPLDLSDSDSEGASPNPRPAAPREIKSAQPKSVKTTVQSGRVRASVTADDEDDSDASQDSDNAMKTVLEKLVKQKGTEDKKHEKNMRRITSEYELAVDTALGELNTTLEGELAAHEKKVRQFHKQTADALKKIKAADEDVQKKRKEFDQAADVLSRKIKKDTATAVSDTLPKSKAVTAAIDKDVAKLKGISKRHAKTHASVVAQGLPWDKLAGMIQKWGQDESAKCLRSLNDITNM